MDTTWFQREKVEKMAYPEGMRAIPREPGFLLVDDEKLYYETVGAGEPVVFCHGMGGNGGIWYQQVAAFASQYQVVVWDQRGFGRSTDNGRRCNPVTAVQDLRRLLDHLDIDRAHLIGQSMGGWAALGFAVEAPDRVRSLTLASTTAGIPLPPEIVHSAAQKPTTDRPETQLLGRHPAIDERLSERDPALSYLYQVLGSFGAERSNAAMMTELLATAYDSDRIAKVDCPVLFVFGENDQTIPAPLIKVLAASVRGALTVEIPEAGHSPYFESAFTWNTIVKRFLESRAAPSSESLIRGLW